VAATPGYQLWWHVLNQLYHLVVDRVDIIHEQLIMQFSKYTALKGDQLIEMQFINHA